jgi:hypothetical protein
VDDDGAIIIITPVETDELFSISNAPSFTIPVWMGLAGGFGCWFHIRYVPFFYGILYLTSQDPVNDAGGLPKESVNQVSLSRGHPYTPWPSSSLGGWMSTSPEDGGWVAKVAQFEDSPMDLKCFPEDASHGEMKGEITAILGRF